MTIAYAALGQLGWQAVFANSLLCLLSVWLHSSVAEHLPKNIVEHIEYRSQVDVAIPLSKSVHGQNMKVVDAVKVDLCSMCCVRR